MGRENPATSTQKTRNKNDRKIDYDYDYDSVKLQVSPPRAAARKNGGGNFGE